MTRYIFKDNFNIQIGTAQTQVRKEKEGEKDIIYIIKTINLQQSAIKLIDSTVVETEKINPKYNSSHNQPRDMALNFEEKNNDYYLDKEIDTKISKEVMSSFFDKNFYSDLIRFLPLRNGYSSSTLIFDYNPSSEKVVTTLAVKYTKEINMVFNEKERNVWKVEATDDISNNSTLSKYYIDTLTRKILKQEIDFGGRKVIMELVE
jgi:hypothetical protein